MTYESKGKSFQLYGLITGQPKVWSRDDGRVHFTAPIAYGGTKFTIHLEDAVGITQRRELYCDWKSAIKQEL